MNTILRTANTPTIEVRFSYVSDRYQHSWWWVDGQHEIQFLISVEGDDKTDWPASPPIQDLLHESRNDHDVVLGLGQAGSARWSSSFKTNSKCPSIEVEHACRIQDSGGELACTYFAANDWQASLEQGCLRLSHKKAQKSIELISDELDLLDERLIACRPTNYSKHDDRRATLVWGFVVRYLE